MERTAHLVLRSSNPLVSGHRIDGRCLLPGLAYPDLIFRLAWRHRGLKFSDYRLERLVIAHPLLVSENAAVELRMSFTEIVGGWHIQIRGWQIERDGGRSDELTYAEAELLHGRDELSRRIEVASLKTEARERVSLDVIYERARDSGLSHEGLIRAAGEIYVLPGGALVDVSVDAGLVRERRDVLCHPTLLDAAAMASAALSHGARAGEPTELFVPLAYDRYCLAQPLQRRCYALLESRTFRSVNDIRKLDIDFFDEQGCQVATLQGLTAKRVRGTPGDRIARTRRDAPMTGRGSADNGSVSEAPPAGRNVASGPGSVQESVRAIFSRYLGRGAACIDSNVDFYQLGFQSADLVRITHDIEMQLGMRLAPSLLFEHATLRDLSAFLSQEIRQAGQQTESPRPENVGARLPDNVGAVPAEPVEVAVMSLSGAADRSSGRSGSSVPQVSAHVLAVLEDLKNGALTPGRARELIGEE